MVAGLKKGGIMIAVFGRISDSIGVGPRARIKLRPLAITRGLLLARRIVCAAIDYSQETVASATGNL